MNVHNKHQYNQQQQHSNNNNGNPLMCNICNKTFLKASSLNTHMISHTAKLYCYACNINFDDDAVTYSQHMQVTHNVIMTKDLISRAKANLQRSESMNQQHQTLASIVKVDEEEMTEQPRLMEVFQVQSSTATNGQIPKLKITIKKEPMVKQEVHEEGNESDSSSSSSSSSNSSSSSSSSGSSSSSASNNDEKNDNNNIVN